MSSTEESSVTPEPREPNYEQQEREKLGDLLILAMDHRDSLLREIYGIECEPTEEQDRKVSADKGLVFDGLVTAAEGLNIQGGAIRSTIGVLVDERYGSAVAERAKDRGIDLAMPIERSGQTLFSLEYGNFGDGEWMRHVEEFNPDQVKVLVRDNPEGTGNRELQFDRLATVSAALRASGRTFLVELLVPATPAQLQSVDDDAMRYDRDLRPALTVREILELQGAGVEPDVWKIEGLETTDAATAIVAAATQGGRDAVTCIVLGRDAPRERLDHWLEVAAGEPGFRGFAIGRSIWEHPLADYLAGTDSSAQFVDRVSANFTHFAGVWARGRRVQR